MRTLTIILLLVVSNMAIAQTTAIPDVNFEQALINMGLDTGTPDGVVLTANINSVNSLYVNNLVSDLTGIEDFTALKYLNCNNNLLTSLNLTQNLLLEELHCSQNLLASIDVSQNILLGTFFCFNNSLTNLDVTQNTNLFSFSCASNQITNLDITHNTASDILSCDYNQLTNIDVTQNIDLTYLWCDNNILTSLNVTQNTSLTYLNCNFNQITSLNISNNITLTEFHCYGNQLTCLDMKNGYNTNLYTIWASNNSGLNCVEVDNAAYSTTNWTGSAFVFDPQTTFSTNCPTACTVGIGENNFTNFTLYPNPTTGQINISLEDKTPGSLRVLNSLGQVVLEEGFEAVRELDISLNEPSGIYFLQLESEGEVVTKKIIKE